MIRRPLPIVALVVIVVLTALLRNGSQPRTARLDAMQRALENFENAQHLLRRDVISVRAGLLQSFDPLVGDVNALHQALAPLDQAQGKAVSPMIARLHASARRQEALTETLKSDSALLQNSLAYFSTLSARADPTEPADAEAGRLSGAMLRLTLDTSAETQAVVERRISDLARRPASRAEKASRAVLLSHARLLHRLLPQADRRLAALLADDDSAARAALRAWIAQERATAERRAQIYRYALYAFAVVLTLAIANLAFRLAAHLAALRRRGSFERDLARMSAQIVAAHPHEVKARLDDGLARLATHVGADAAFLFGEGDYACARLWPRCPRSAIVDWAPAARAIAEAARAAPDGLFHGRRDWPAPDGAHPPARRADVVAMLLANEHGDTCVLGFAGFKGPVQVRAADLDVMRLSLDILAGAVRRSRTEQRRAALEARLQHAGRMQAMGEFAGGIAHNFNNILGAIAGYGEMAAECLRPASAASRHVEQIGLAVTRARRLVDQIRDYGRRTERPKRPVDLHALLEESVALLTAAHGAAAVFAVEMDGGDHRVLGDAERLQQVILNLASNALQAMGGEGTVRLRLARRANRVPAEQASGVLLAGDYVVLEVADDGPGMTQAVREQIFEPFFTTRAEGTGLGLATTDQAVRDLGGAVAVRSAPGQGAVFEVWLPAPCQGAVRSGPPSGLGETILLLNPDPEQLRADEEQVAALGYEPVGFLRLDAALAALQAWPQRFDAVVARAPQDDLAAALRRAAPGLGLILVGDDPALRATAATLGRSWAAAWPLDPDLIAAVVAAP